MARAKTVSFEERVANEWLDDARKVAQRIAVEQGPPPNAGKVSEDRMLRDWGIKDPVVDPHQFMVSLMTTGLNEAQVNALQVVKENPSLRQVYAQPAEDFKRADELTRLAEFPLRYGMVTDYSDEPKEQVKFAKSLNARWQKQFGEAPPPPDQASGGAAPIIGAAPDPALRGVTPAPAPMGPPAGAPQPPMQQPPAAAPMPMGGQ